MKLAKEVWSNNGEGKLKEYAQAIAKKITIRAYDEKGSIDTIRETTLPERKIIGNIVYGALLAIRDDGDIQTAADTAEFIGMQFLPEANSYDTFYNPIKDYRWDA